MEAEFEKHIRGLITKHEYPYDIDQLISWLRRQFKEEKKDCGFPSLNPHKTFAAPKIRANNRKGFERNLIKIER